jgi:uncharacterized protein
VLILPTTQPEDIAQFGIRLAEAWKIGRAASDDGAILVVAKDDRALRIEVGHGLEGALTDVTSSRIINETIVPLFKQGDFYGGVNAGLDQMIRVIEGEPLPEPDRAWKPVQELGDKFPVLIFVAFAILGVLRRFVGRLPAAVSAGVAGGGIAWWITSKLLLALGIGAGAFFLALLFGFGSTYSPRRGGRVFRDLGGGWGGFGGRGGFGGGGGFSGGGGSFGGGGASGRW